jgi:hypothetical protein
MKALTRSEKLHSNPVLGQMILPLLFFAISSKACQNTNSETVINPALLFILFSSSIFLYD